MARRSVLFSPGDQRDKLEGAIGSRADVVVFDLEDGVAPEDRPQAREVVTAALSGIEVDAGPEILVRLNPLDLGGADDIEAIVKASDALDGVVQPKVTSTSQVYHLLGRLRETGLPRAVWCLIESPSGVLEARSIGAIDGVEALVFGGEDYTAAIGGERTETGTELLYARQHVVASAAATGIDAIDGISTSLDDMAPVRREAAEARTFGFDGKLAIHPAQLDPIHEAFTPDETQLAWARRVLEAAETADGGVFRVDDEMIDAPLIERARQLVERANE